MIVVVVDTYLWVVDMYSLVVDSYLLVVETYLLVVDTYLLVVDTYTMMQVVAVQRAREQMWMKNSGHVGKILEVCAGVTYCTITVPSRQL